MTDTFDINTAFPSPYLKHTDIGDADKVLTIAGIEWQEIGQDRERKMVLRFRESEKIFVLNKTNANALVTLYGNPLNKSIGKRIALYKTEVSFAGKQTLALRIRLRPPQVAVKPAAAPVPPEEPTEDEWVEVPEDEPEDLSEAL